MPDEAASSSHAAGSNEAESGSPREAAPEAPTQVEGSEASSVPTAMCRLTPSHVRESCLVSPNHRDTPAKSAHPEAKTDRAIDALLVRID